MARASEVLATLRAMGDPSVREGYARFAIPQDRAVGIPMGETKRLARSLGRDHDLAVALWEDGLYEARMVAIHVAEPDRTDLALADRWVRGFDNWAHCDTACFVLFDRTGWRWDWPQAWAASEAEFVRRTPFALIWALSTHDKAAPDTRFEAALALIEATDPLGLRYVEKAQDMALRGVGKRNRALNRAALAVAERLAGSGDRARARIGRSALRDLASEKVRARLAG